MSAVILQPAVHLHTAGAADYRHKRGLPHSSIGAPSSRPMFMVRRKTRTGSARPLVRAYYGFLGNCHRARKLARCRELIGMAPAGPAAETPADYRDRFEALTGRSLRKCPHCHIGTMVMIDCIARPKICQPVPDTS